jgi:hypothetical protein
MKKSFIKPQDNRFVNKLKIGWKADRDWNNAWITDGVKHMKISLACYNRLFLEGLLDS